MSGNLDSDRSVTSSKMFPIDLAPQKITIVKSGANTEVKMAHIIPGQPKTSTSSQLLTHANTGSGMMRPGLAQIISPGVSSQPQMIVSGPPILQGTQIVSQGSQLIGPSTQIISQSQLITATGQILSPATQIISQGTQLSAQVSNASNIGSSNQTGVSSSASGTQVMSVGGQLVSGGGNLVVNSSVRTLPPTVRVLPPLPHHNTRPALLSSVNVSNTGSVLVSKGVSVGVTSHVPRGLAAGASLAVRPVAPTSATQSLSQGGWSSNGRAGRGALVYGARASTPRGPTVPPAPSTPASQTVPVSTPHSAIVSLPTTTVLNSSGVVMGAGRGTTGISAPRPLPLLQRNFQPPKVVGVASVGVRGVVGNSAPAQLYYEVPRATHASPHAPHATLSTLSTLATHAPQQPQHQTLPRPLTPYAHPSQQLSTQVSVVNTVAVSPDPRSSPATSIATAQIQPRPSILRKRDVDGSPSKAAGGLGMGNLGLLSGVNVMGLRVESTGTGTGWEDVPPSGCASGGSTTISASSSPAPDDEPDLPRLEPDLSPRKKPRKQILSSEVRQCEYQPEEPQRAPSPVSFTPPPKRPLLSSSYVCGWRGTALHFVRPADVRRREPRARDILAIAAQRHVLTSADGWKVHHLTAQMDDLVSLESDVGDQLTDVLKVMENASGRALSALQPHTHALLELLKGNIQRSKIVCEGIQEAREDILRVFTHRNFVSDILTRQADKRCFRKHRSQS